MERFFVDPVIHSRRLERVQVLVFAGVLIMMAAAVWIKWLTSGAGAEAAKIPLMMSGAVAAGFGLGYYMLKRNRRVMLDQVWVCVSEQGIASHTPAGTVEVSWPEVIEVRIGLIPSRNRIADVVIKTDKGLLSTFMRYADKNQPLPEPVPWNPGRRFARPDGQRFTLTPGNSPLVKALKEHLAPEKIKQGVILSL